MAERKGFEPLVPCGTPLFESGQFNHSCISPSSIYFTTLFIEKSFSRAASIVSPTTPASLYSGYWNLAIGGSHLPYSNCHLLYSKKYFNIFNDYLHLQKRKARSKLMKREIWGYRVGMNGLDNHITSRYFCHI